MKHVIDLTHPITPDTPHHPCDVKATLKKIRSLADNSYNDYQLTTGMHVGTHIDGPKHMLEDAPMLSKFPARYFICPGVLIDARDKTIDARLLEGIKIKPDSIVLVLTGHEKKWGTPDYYSNNPVVHQDFAQALIPFKINMLGFDLPSPDNAPYEIHKTLLKRNILIIENLANLEQLVEVGEFTIAAFPLNIETDSSPARVIAFY